MRMRASASAAGRDGARSAPAASPTATHIASFPFPTSPDRLPGRRVKEDRFGVRLLGIRARGGPFLDRPQRLPDCGTDELRPPTRPGRSDSFQTLRGLFVEIDEDLHHMEVYIDGAPATSSVRVVGNDALLSPRTRQPRRGLDVEKRLDLDVHRRGLELLEPAGRRQHTCVE